MRAKQLLAALLLGVGLCCVPVLGYGEVRHKAYEMNYRLLEARVSYIMLNPTNFLDVVFYYDPDGTMGNYKIVPAGVDMKGKIYVQVADNRGVFSYKSGVALLDQFKRELEAIRLPIFFVATDLDTDIVAIFCDRENIPLGYFYQGEYHLWEE